MRQPQRAQELLDEMTALRTRLMEVEETLTAIRQGRVDAVVMDGPQGEEISTLQGADQPYRVMIESMQEGAITLAADGTILYSNARFAWLVRSPLERVVGTSMSHFIAAADQPQFAVLLEHGLAVGSRGELQITTSDGTHIPVLLSLTSLSAYEVPAVCVVVTDLTDQKRYAELTAVQEALRESERRFREMINALPAAIYTTDAAGRLTHFNPAAVEFSGRVPELGTTEWCVSWKLYYPDGTPMPHDQCPMAVALKEGRAVRGVEAIAERPDGTRAWFQPYPTPLRDGAGRIVGGINMLVDITERKRAEEASLRLAAIVESSDDAIVSKSLDGIVTSWNAAAERIFGYRAEEMIGQPILRLLPVDRQDEEVMILARLRRGERIDHFETVRRAKDGRLLDVAVTISPLRDARGVIIGASKIVRDIGARKQAEAEREALLAELQRANTEFQQFSYIVSHDLNEPLRTMSNYVQLLARRTKGKLDGSAEEYMAFVTDAAKRMQQMLTDLLAYTHAGQTPEFQAVDCEEMLAQMVNDLHTAITEQQATLTHDPLPTVRGDATRLKQVLQNLIGNALKFRGQAPPQVHVSAQRGDGHWRFAVRDNGIGIDPQHVGKLFQVFQRLHTRREYAGSGIGLAICKRIVEQHGGRIWVESRPQEGSVFYFTISDKQ